MKKDTIWYHCHRYSPGWLAWMESRGKQVSAEDVARIIEADPEHITDPILGDYILRGLRGELRRKPGRPAKGLGHLARILLAEDLVRERIAERKAANEPRRKRGVPGLSETVHEEVARMMKLGSGRSLANAISSLKRNALFGE